MKCYDCPRGCGVDRDDGETGYCGGGRFARIAKIINDFDYEEPCLGRVTALFFGGCSLGCSYCQNKKISRACVGDEYDERALARAFDGATYPLDLVTPSHFLTAIEKSVALCRTRPSVIYNTSGYETPDAVMRASAFTDVFLTDFKYADAAIADRFSHASDYPKIAVAALVKMRDAVVDEWQTVDGKKLLKRGLIVRHLVLPDNVKNSIAVLDTVASAVGTDVVLSLMSQFTPNGDGTPDRKLEKIEYKIVAEHALKLGFKNGYFQRFSSARSEYTPDF